MLGSVAFILFTMSVRYGQKYLQCNRKSGAHNQGSVVQGEASQRWLAS